MFIFLDKQKERLNLWLKKRTTMDFSDWGAFILFVSGLGLFVILFLSQNLNLSDLISAVVLWFTVIIILQYTKETHWLKRISQEQLKQSKYEEVVRNRAYLTVQNCRFDQNDIDISSTFKVVFNIINKGTTPAQKISVKKYLTSLAPNGKRFGECDVGAIQNYLVPEHVHRYQFPFSEQDSSFVLEAPGGEKVLAVEVIYSDYHEERYILTSYYQVRYQRLGPRLTLKERHEKIYKI